MKNLFPKNKKASKTSGQLFFHLLIVLPLFFVVPTTNGQQRGEGSLSYQGVSKQDGMLVFSNESTFQAVYADLDRQILAYSKDPKNPYEVDDETCEDNGVLAAFESNFRAYVSARKAGLLNECSLLEKGVDPMDIKNSWIVADETVAAMVNEKFEVKVGNSIFWMPPLVIFAFANFLNLIF